MLGFNKNHEDSPARKKRDRSVNFSTSEKSILADIISCPIHKNIIENKKTDGSSIRQKEASWLKVTQEFNSNLCVNKRTVKQLQQAWTNMKRETKKEVANQRMELIKTGGGGYVPPLDDSKMKVLGIIKTQATPMENDYDNDSVIGGE